MSAVEVRAAAEGDVEAACAIGESWLGMPRWGIDGWRRELSSERSRFLVAEENGVVVGCAVLWIVASQAQLAAVAVRRDRTRRGFGRLLLERSLDAARRAGCSVVTLEVGAANEAAESLYRAAGFVVVGRRSKYYNDGSDALLMDKQL